MFLVAFQTILAALACYGLWRLLRTISGYGRAAGVIVGVGFAGRALLAQALFWISYLRLPLGRSLQLGPGFWFFGSDAEFYFQYATEFSNRPLEILSFASVYPSWFFVQIFTSAVMLFGAVPSVGILLNCAAFLGICLLIAWLGSRGGQITLPTIFALAAVSFSPSGVLWSMQPLKDTLFLFMVTAAVAASVKWHELWTSKRRVQSIVLPLLACALAIAIAVYGISSMRWYFGVILWLSFAVLFAGIVFSTSRRVAAVLVNVSLLVLLLPVISGGARTDIPEGMRFLFDWPRPSRLVSLPHRVVTMLNSVRRGYDLTPGATMIAAGRALEPEAKSAPPPAPAPAQTPPAPAQTSPAPVPPPVVVQAPVDAKPQQPAPPPPPSVVPVQAPAPPPAVTLPPTSTKVRLISGSAATILPRAVAQKTGLIRVGGGRGFWLFADLDTIVFDVVLLFSIVYCARSVLRRRGRLPAVFLQVVVIFVLVAVPVIYTVSNFGTLFRLRQMIYLALCLLPVAMVRGEKQEEPPQPAEAPI